MTMFLRKVELNPVNALHLTSVGDFIYVHLKINFNYNDKLMYYIMTSSSPCKTYPKDTEACCTAASP